jgi:hypothetical protein
MVQRSEADVWLLYRVKANVPDPQIRPAVPGVRGASEPVCRIILRFKVCLSTISRPFRDQIAKRWPRARQLGAVNSFPA